MPRGIQINNPTPNLKNPKLLFQHAADIAMGGDEDGDGGDKHTHQEGGGNEVNLSQNLG